MIHWHAISYHKPSFYSIWLKIQAYKGRPQECCKTLRIYKGLSRDKHREVQYFILVSQNGRFTSLGSQSVAIMVIEGTRRFDLKKSWEILLYWRKRKRSTGSLLCFDVWWDLIRELSWHEIPLSNPPWQNIKKTLQGFHEPNNLYILEKNSNHPWTSSSNHPTHDMIQKHHSLGEWWHADLACWERDCTVRSTH